MGSIQGGKKAAATNKAQFGDDWYKVLGRMGGSAPKTKPSGFAAMNRADVQAAGKKGGLISRRCPTEEQLKHQSEAMKARWASKKAEQA